MAGRCGADPPPGSGPKLETLRSDEGSRIGETSLYAVPAVRASRLERPDGAVLELAAERVVSSSLERPDLRALRRGAAHGPRDRAAARQAQPAGPVRARGRGPAAARARPARPLMCGIVGYTGRRDAAPRPVEGLKRLEYRGYDSAGAALANGGGVVRRTPAARAAPLACRR